MRLKLWDLQLLGFNTVKHLVVITCFNKLRTKRWDGWERVWHSPIDAESCLQREGFCGIVCGTGEGCVEERV